MTIIDTTPGLSAADLATSTSVSPLTAYCRGWEDAYYQRVYMNSFSYERKLWHEYFEGHEDGTEARCLTANAG